MSRSQISYFFFAQCHWVICNQLPKLLSYSTCVSLPQLNFYSSSIWLVARATRATVLFVEHFKCELTVGVRAVFVTQNWWVNCDSRRRHLNAYTVNDSRWWFCIGFPNWTMIHPRLTHGLLATTNTRFGYEMDTAQFKLWMRNESNWIWWIFWCTVIAQNAADACIASPKQTKSIFWHFFYCLQRMFSKCLARSECVQWCHYVDVNAHQRWMWWKEMQKRRVEQVPLHSITSHLVDDVTGNESTCLVNIVL